MTPVDTLQPLDLSQDDYKGLRTSPDIRAHVIEKVAAQYRHRKLSREAHTLAEDIRRVLAAGDRATYERLYTKCHVGERLFPLLHAALALYDETISDHSEEDAERFGRRIMERLLTFSPRTEPETFERLLEKLNSCSQSSAA